MNGPLLGGRIVGMDPPDLDLGQARSVLAAGLIGGDYSEEGLIRFAGVSLSVAQSTIAKCREEELIDSSGRVDPSLAVTIIGSLSPEAASAIRTRVARAWLSVGSQHFLAEVDRARHLGSFVATEEVVEMSDHAGRITLSLHEYQLAADLLQLAMELDVFSEPIVIARRLIDLAAAFDGLGRVSDGRDALAQAALLGEMAGDESLVAAAAVRYALPIDWYAGDIRANGLLDRAAQMELGMEDTVQVMAARALVEMRIPISNSGDQQLAWVSRPQVAHSLSESALESSRSLSIETRALATLVWRSTHRSPRDLDRRREISRESLNFAQILRSSSNQVEASVWMAVDAIESADRSQYDEALSVARWIAERDGNPRLLRRAHTLCCGSAHMDGDIVEAERWRLRAREVGQSIATPGWFAGDLLFFAQKIASERDPAEMVASISFEDSPGIINPIGRSLLALMHAEVGSAETARGMVHKALRQLDMESSYLFLATRCADVVLSLRDEQLAKQLVTILEPWRTHVAVDSNGWWIDGPVNMWLAGLWGVTGDEGRAIEAMAAAEKTARRMDDIRSLRRIEDIRQRFQVMGPHSGTSEESDEERQVLSERQMTILRMMSEGLTNREIGGILSFSTSTIRLESIAIYRTLGVKGRTEAVRWLLEQ